MEMVDGKLEPAMAQKSMSKVMSVGNYRVVQCISCLPSGLPEVRQLNA